MHNRNILPTREAGIARNDSEHKRLPFDESATYTIATSDFISVGGDTYHALAESSGETIKGIDCLIADALYHFLKDAHGGTVPHEYEQPQGRIVIT